MKLIVLDRDGVINYDSPSYIKSADEWRPIPGSADAIARLNQAGFHVVVATNQSGVGRGLYDMAALNAIHEKLHRVLAQAGARVDAIFFCPHPSEANCNCRKPKTGMFEDIARRFNTSLAGVPVIGDSMRDLEAAVAVKAAPMLVLTGNGKKTQREKELPPGTRIFTDLSAAVEALVD